MTPVVERYGDRYRVVGGEWEAIEGDHRLIFPLLIEFPTSSGPGLVSLREYRPLRELRHRSATANAVLLGTAEPDALLNE